MRILTADIRGSQLGRENCTRH